MALAAVISACSDNDDAGESSGEDSGDTTDPDTTTMQDRLGVFRLASRAPATVPAASAVFFAVDDAPSSATLETVRAQLLPDAGTCVLQSELLSPQAQTVVSVDSVFRWGAPLEQGGDERAFLLLIINSEDVITNTVLCAFPEDEAFTLPDATIAALQARNEVNADGSIGAVFGFGAMRVGERQVDDRTRLLMRMMRFTQLPRP